MGCRKLSYYSRESALGANWKILVDGLEKSASVLKKVHDYSTFGMLMPGRHENSAQYRFGFQGQEKDDEVSGNGNSYDFGARIYNPRIGKFLSVDPKWRTYPYYSPYAYAANNPTYYIDKEGKGPLHPRTGKEVKLYVGVIGWENMWFYSVGQPTKDKHGVTDNELQGLARFYPVYFDLFFAGDQNPTVTDGLWEYDAVALIDNNDVPEFQDALHSTITARSWFTSKTIVEAAASTKNYVFSNDKQAFQKRFGFYKVQKYTTDVFKVENNIVVEQVTFSLKEKSDRNYYTLRKITYDVSNYTETISFEVGDDNSLIKIKTISYNVVERTENYDKNGNVTSKKEDSYSKNITSKETVDSEE